MRRCRRARPRADSRRVIRRRGERRGSTNEQRRSDGDERCGNGSARVRQRVASGCLRAHHRDPSTGGPRTADGCRNAHMRPRAAEPARTVRSRWLTAPARNPYASAAYTEANPVSSFHMVIQVAAASAPACGRCGGTAALAPARKPGVTVSRRPGTRAGRAAASSPSDAPAFGCRRLREQPPRDGVGGRGVPAARR